MALASPVIWLLCIAKRWQSLVWLLYITRDGEGVELLTPLNGGVTRARKGVDSSSFAWGWQAALTFRVLANRSRDRPAKGLGAGHWNGRIGSFERATDRVNRTHEQLGAG